MFAFSLAGRLRNPVYCNLEDGKFERKYRLTSKHDLTKGLTGRPLRLPADTDETCGKSNTRAYQNAGSGIDFLAYGNGICDRCKIHFREIIQHMHVTCTRCKKSYQICPKCKPAGCLRCRGKLLSELDKAELNRCFV